MCPSPRLLCFAVLLAGVAGAPAHVVLCKYVDDNGHVTYSDSAVKGAKKMSCFDPPPTPPAPAPRATAPTSGTNPNAAPTPAGAAPQPQASLPKVEPDTQRKRDDTRRKILMDELSAEERALADARKALSDGEATRQGDERNYQRYLDRVQGLKERVAQHERNVNALRQELANLR